VRRNEAEGMQLKLENCTVAVGKAELRHELGKDPVLFREKRMRRNGSRSEKSEGIVAV
jgi:hypothetical protein